MASSSHSRTVQWDVFLSFCGKDTRTNFTDHLYEALKKKGIATFRDDEKLPRGDEILSGLLSAIEASRFSVVVLSKSYPFSRWCLSELAKIVECMKEQENTIFPVFYKVDPSDVRKQAGKFKEAFEEHKKKIENDIDKQKVERWRTALQEVGNISGWVSLGDRPESQLIQDIVDVIFKRLDPYLFSSIPKDIVGINPHVGTLINKYLEVGLEDFRFVGIHGMGGIGKTTIARAVYQLLSNHYEDKCFLADVRDRSKQKGLEYLQKRLLSEVLKESNLKIGNVVEGTNMIKRRLFQRKVFIVLDDVDDRKQLEALAQADWFDSRSRIIITTRNKHLLFQNGVKEKHICDVKRMDDADALKLLQLQAFKRNKPTDDLVKLSKQITDYAEGLPLALKVLGSFLCDRRVNEWKSASDKLKKHPPKEIIEVLRISYDGLDETNKEVFLDIACFFNGRKKIRVKEILQYKYDFDLEIVIQELIEKCLITVSSDKIWMHDMIQKMGQGIVIKNRDGHLGKQTRLWSYEDVHSVLQQENMGTCAIEGIMLDNPEKKGITNLKGKAFSNISNLRLLKVISTDCQLSEDLECLPNGLRFLKWLGYPFKSLPSDFNPENLCELNMCNSHIEYLLEGMKPLEKLKIIKLSHSCKLIRAPDFTKVPNLERLDLEGCISLQEFRQSVGSLRKLTVLNLKNCRSLASFVVSDSGLTSLKLLNLDGCVKLDKLPENLGKSVLLEELYINVIALGQLPSSISQLIKKKSLRAFYARGFEAQLPRTIFFHSVSKSQRSSQSKCLSPPLTSYLTRVELVGCNIASLPLSQEENLSKIQFVTTPESIKHLSEPKYPPSKNSNSSNSLLKPPQKMVSVRSEGPESLKRLPSTLIDLCNPREIAVQLFDSFNPAENNDGKSNLSKKFLKRWFQDYFKGESYIHDNGAGNELAIVDCIDAFITDVEFSNDCSPFFYSLPGSKIPRWFSYSAEGDSVTIELPLDEANAKFMGFAVCAVFTMPPDYKTDEELITVSCSLKIGFSSFGVKFSIRGFTRIESDCLCLGYLSNANIIGEEYIFPGGRVQVEFRILDRSRSWNTFVKRCGILPVISERNVEYLRTAEDKDSIIEQYHDKQLAVREAVPFGPDKIVEVVQLNAAQEVEAAASKTKGKVKVHSHTTAVGGKASHQSLINSAQVVPHATQLDVFEPQYNPQDIAEGVSNPHYTTAGTSQRTPAYDDIMHTILREVKALRDENKEMRFEIDSLRKAVTDLTSRFDVVEMEANGDDTKFDGGGEANLLF